jgi:hypothetical protein
MLELIRDLPAGIDGIRAVGEVNRHDYDRVVQPLLDKARSEGRRLRLLYHLGPEFTGFTAGAVWEDLQVGIRYLRLLERCAIVSDHDWIRRTSQAMALLMPCPLRIFRDNDRPQAIEWLAAQAQSSLRYRMLPDRGVLVIEPSGPLRSEDFDLLATVVDPWIEQTGELPGIVVHVREFPGWQNVGSFIRHVRFVRDHHRKVRRVALAANSRIAELVPTFADVFVSAEIRRFEYEDEERAIEWAATGSGDH